MINFFSSLSFLNPVANIALISLVIPIIIHLINRSRGQLVYIGNIEFVKQAKKITVTQLKLTQWLLLLLRLLFFAILTLLVSKLIRETELTKADETHIYLTPYWQLTANTSEFMALKESYPSAKILSLTTGFPEVSENNFQNFSGKQINTYSAVAELMRTNYVVTTAMVFSRDSLKNYPQLKPQLPENIEWVVNSIPEKEHPTPLLGVQIFFDQTRVLDKEILRVAFDILNKQGGRSFALEFVGIGESPILTTTFSADWIFWLSDREVAVEIIEFVKQGSFLLTDITASQKNAPNLVEQLGFAKISNLDVEFFQSNTTIQKTSDILDNVLWRDNNNREILTSLPLGKGSIYKFNSRFNPLWNNLVEKSEFPWVLSRLLQVSEETLEQLKISPSEINNFETTLATKISYENLNHWLILLLSLLWFAERWLAEKRKVLHG